ncbi:hypothetical protein [Pseudoduganella violaceinigra]|uniref:hypothetical protein n=1 Tax=Pseudoduganella violaceinigra TaxID=246602 RepID=UPI00041C40DB|nr:hypothetical protein [Pseudoduganella violaceinigra]
MQAEESENRELDGSSHAAKALLAELCALSGQVAASPPVLELQFGAVLTHTAVEDGPGGPCLSISARLPAQRGEGYAAPAWQGEGIRFGGLDCMWHADEGCHIAVRRIALARLGDERSLMDAILETADMAQAWHGSMALDQPPAC